jgi:hypothetical protein
MEIEFESMIYANKVEKISPEVREYVRSELDWIAKQLRKNNPDLSYTELRKFLNEMVSVSV